RIDYGAAHLAGDHHVAVLAAQADRLATRLVDVADDLFVDRTGQHHLDDLDRGRVGDAQPVGELGLDAETLEHPADLRAAAVHPDRIDRGLLEQDDVACELARQVLVAHGMAAVLHHDDLLVVALHVRQRFGQDAGLLVGIDGHFGDLWLRAIPRYLAAAAPSRKALGANTTQSPESWRAHGKATGSTSPRLRGEVASEASG